MKKFGVFLLLLGLLSIGAYFVIGPEFSNSKVVFNSNGGTTISEQIVKKGEKANEPTTPVKENSTFVEWQLNGKKYDFNSPVTADITLNAIWDEYKMFTVKVTVDSNDYSSQVKEGETLSVDSLGIPVQEGYRLVLYNEANEEYNVSTPVTSDLNLTGSILEIKKYKVTFNSNGGSKVDTKEVVEGTNIEEPTTTRSGYDFAGWYLGDTKFDFTTPISKSITLKAKWTEKGKVNVIFMVDSKVYKTIPVKEGTKVTKPANPTKSGYKFVEWQLDGSKFDFNTKIESETTLTAVWEEAQSYTVKFDSDGGSKVSDVEVNAGEKLKAPTAPTKSNYKFVEWQLSGKKYDFSKVVTSDMTLKAKWEKIVKYTVKFDSNGGGSVPDQEVIAGEKAKEPTCTRSGYKLEGWVYDSKMFSFDTPINGNITLTARWSKLDANPDVPDTPDIPDVPSVPENNNE